jgi:hypothetical protein
MTNVFRRSSNIECSISERGFANVALCIRSIKISFPRALANSEKEKG